MKYLFRFGTLNFSASESRPVLKVMGQYSVPFAMYSNGSLYLNYMVDRELKDSFQFAVRMGKTYLNFPFIT